MYIIVSRQSKQNIGVLDIDTMKVIRTDIDSVWKMSGVSGATTSEGINFDYVKSFNKYIRLRYEHLKIYCNNLDVPCDNCSNLSCIDFDNYIEKMKLQSPMAYLMCYGLLLRRLKYDDFEIVIGDNSYKISKYDYESIVLFCLYGLYNNINITVLYTSDDNSPDFKYIRENSKFIAYKNRIYFCDAECTVSISKKDFEAIEGVAKRRIRNTKYALMKSGLQSSIASDDIIVSSCRRLEIKDNRCYIFPSGMLYIDDLVIDLSKKAKLVFKDRCVLIVDVVSFIGDKSVAASLIRRLSYNSSGSYITNKDSFDRSFSDRLVLRGLNISLSILDYTDEDWINFIRYIIGDNLLNRIQNNEDISEKERRVVYNLYNSLCNNGVTTTDVLNILKFHEYNIVSSTEFINMYRSKDFNNMLSEASVGFYFKGVDVDDFWHISKRTRFYDKIFNAMAKKYEEIRKLSKYTGGVVIPSYDFGFVVECYSALDSSLALQIESFDKFTILRHIDSSIADINKWILEEYGIVLSYSMAQYNNMELAVYVNSVTHNSRKSIPDSTMKKIYSHMRSLGFQVEFNSDLVKKYNLRSS